MPKSMIPCRFGQKRLGTDEHWPEVKLESRYGVRRLGPGAVFLLLAILMAVFLGACTPRSMPPGPSSAAGVVGQAGYEFLQWEQGLGLLIWHDAIGACSFSSAGGTGDPTYTVDGSCEAHDGRRFSWEVQTADGRHAQLEIANAVSQISGDTVVLVMTRGDEAGVRLLRRDLSALQTNQENIAEFAQRDPDMAGFIEGMAHPRTGPVVPLDDLRARETLVRFFDLLHSGQFDEAARLYGGSYEIMIKHNPGVDPQDHGALFRKACTINGAQCLNVRRAVPEGRVAGNGFRFLVEFQHDNGAPFLLGPCCGANETDQPPQSRFLYSVERTNEGSYLVLNRPVYVP